MSRKTVSDTFSAPFSALSRYANYIIEQQVITVTKECKCEGNGVGFVTVNKNSWWWRKDATQDLYTAVGIPVYPPNFA